MLNSNPDFPVFVSHAIDLFAKLKMLKVHDVFTLKNLCLCLIIAKITFIMNLRGFLLLIMIFTHI